MDVNDDDDDDDDVEILLLFETPMMEKESVSCANRAMIANFDRWKRAILLNILMKVTIAYLLLVDRCDE